MATTDSHRLWLLSTLLVTGWLLWLLSPILMPFVVSALLAYLGDPLVDRLERHRLNRTAAVSVVFSMIFLLLLGLLLLLVPRIEAQITQLLQRLPGYLNWLHEALLPRIEALLPDDAPRIDLELLQNTLTKHWRDAGGMLAQVLESISGSGLALLAWIANLVLIPVLTFYLLRDWDHLMAGLHALLPRRNAPTIAKLASEADAVLGAFLRGQVMVMIALGVIYTTGLWFVGLDLALLIGMLAGIVSFVPYLGLVVGILVAGIAAVLQFQGWEPLPWVILVFVVGQLIEGSVLTPRLVGGQIGLHPVAVIFAVMAGGQLYGFFGILLALPVAAVGMVVVRHLVQNYRASAIYDAGDDREMSSDKIP
jgi:predicted PurR-regulated permease PerM